MLRAGPKRSVPEFTIVKAEAKAPHVAPAPNVFPKRSAIPELVGYPAKTVYSAGSESPLSRGSGTQAPHCASQFAARWLKALAESGAAGHNLGSY